MDRRVPGVRNGRFAPSTNVVESGRIGSFSFTIGTSSLGASLGASLGFGWPGKLLAGGWWVVVSG